jgi:zinc protease
VSAGAPYLGSAWRMGQPGELARRQFLEQVYGVGHPYGVSPVPGTVEGLVRADLEAFHREHFAPRNALLVVSGQVERAQVERLAEQHFGGWQGTAAAGRATLPTPAGAAPTRIHLVHRPGSTQSNIWIGHLATEPGHPDYFPLQVLNSILGGGVDARLFQILREEKGWTYGAYSRFTRPQDVGYFSANAEVRTEVTDSAVAEILHQLHRLRDEPVPQEEFDAAVSFLAGRSRCGWRRPARSPLRSRRCGCWGCRSRRCPSSRCGSVRSHRIRCGGRPESTFARTRR